MRKTTAIRRIKTARQSAPARFFAKYAADRADDHAMLISSTALFAIFPLVGAILTLAGMFLQDERHVASLVAWMKSVLPEALAPLLGFIYETREITGLLGLVTLAGLVWSGSALFGRMSVAFNHFYGCAPRRFLAEKLLAVGMMFVTMLLGMASVIASSATGLLLALSAAHVPFELPEPGLLDGLTSQGIAFAAAFLVFLSEYWLVPNVRHGPRAVWKGALLATVLLVALNQLFPLYLQLFGGGFEAYKTLGLFLLLLTWLYFMARILVLGCELNVFLALEARAVHEPPLQALLALEAGAGARAVHPPEAGSLQALLGAGATAPAQAAGPRESRGWVGGVVRAMAILLVLLAGLRAAGRSRSDARSGEGAEVKR